MSGQAVRLTKLFELGQLGVNTQSISFNTVSLESDKFICVKEQSGSIAMIDVATQSVTRNNVSVDAALMNPSKRILALRSQQVVQIFDLEKKVKLNSWQSPEPVVFWKWVDSSELAVVTQSGVYHWSIATNTEQPKMMFSRSANLAAAQIINYRCDHSKKWLLLIGIAQENGAVKGVMQLWSVERSQTQPIDGHAAAFAQVSLPGRAEKANLVCIASHNNADGKLIVLEMAPPAGEAPFKKVAPIQFSDANDFPVAMQVSGEHGFAYLITRSGFLYVYDVENALCVFSNRISQQDPVFATTLHTQSKGLMGISRSGSVLVVSVDEKAMVKHFTDSLGNYEAAIRFTSRANLSVGNELFEQQFNRMLSEQPVNLQRIAQLASQSPKGCLRTPQTIQRISQLPATPGQPSPMLQYFKALLDSGKLNAFETVELAKLALQKQGGVQYLEKLMTDDKITCSEELGDLVGQTDRDIALKMYYKGNAHNKVVMGLVQKGAFQQIFQYCQKVEFVPDYHAILAHMIGLSPDQAVQFATQLVQQDRALIDVNRVVDMFVQRSMIQQVAGFLLEVLKDDKPEDGALQTRLLEINLMYNYPQVADQILANEMFSHYDKRRVAQLCEKAGLYQRAIENYSDIVDIKRCVVYTQAINPEWLVNFFGNLSIEDTMVCLKELLNNNIVQNLQIVVQIATKYCEELTPAALIGLFETFKSFEGLFYFLGSIVNYSEDPDVHFKYIEAATKIGQFQEVERVTRESNFYDPERVRDFLKEQKLADMWPLINVCDRFDFVEDLMKFLYNNQQMKYIEPFVQRKNPLRTPIVVGALLDVDASEEYIKNLIDSVGNMCPVEPLVEEVEKRNRLKVIKVWLEARVREGNEDPVLHNSVAKIYIDSNLDPERFLKENEFYDSLVVGKYCEKRDPHLALIAYKRGKCDMEIVALTNKNSMFRDLARYVVDREDAELWGVVLDSENENRRDLIDQVVQTALPETREPEKVSCAVKAFMTADLPNELIELLEKIVLHGESEFKTNRNLQNLLILTAMKADRDRVMDYVERLDNYDAEDLAGIAIASELFEEAFAIYKKAKLHNEAMKVLLDNVGSIERGKEYATKVNEPEVWSLLGSAQLDKRIVDEAVDSLLKAEDATPFQKVISICNEVGAFEDLVRFLHMARQHIKESVIDSELVYAYAKIDQLSELEDFISGSNIAKLQQVGDRLFTEKMYQAAKIIFSHISNYPRLASTLVRLKSYQQAFEAARKANATKTWKEVCLACVNAKEFRLAQMCGLHIIVHADELEQVVAHYEFYGYFDELITLLEAGLGLERAHMGLFTELGIQYAKYRPTKLMDHLKVYVKKCNIPKLLRVCEHHHHWSELRFLYQHYDEFDNAALVMMNHPSVAFEHSIFKEVMAKVASSNMYYRAVQFYLTNYPTLLCDLLNSVSEKIDNSRVVHEVRREGHLPLIKSYLLQVQSVDVPAVNEAVNQLHVQDEDYEALRHSFDAYKNFDQIALAMQCEKHDLLEFRRIAAYIYKENERYTQSVELSKKDMLLKDVIATAADSKSRDVAENVIKFFIEIKRMDCFSASLYSCYDVLRPDFVMELAWRHGITYYAMPYMVQSIREYTDKVESLIKDKKARDEDKKKQDTEPAMPPPTAIGMQPTGMIAVQPTGMIAMQPTGMMVPGTMMAPRAPPRF